MNSPKNSKAASVIFDQVTKVYPPDVTAVDHVDFQIKAGTLVTFLGPSGCGKTTTLRMIAGLEMPTSGTIMIGSTDVTKVPATERDVSMVFQSYALFPHMNVLDNVSYGLKFAGHEKQVVKDKAVAGLELVGLAGYGDRLPSELSGGQQQRVAVARALVLEPQVLLFDEPLSNLDAKLRRQVREEIREIQQDLGLTVVYVTHDQEEALAVSDRIIVMDKAVVAQDGTPRELYEEPESRFVADFIGEANIMPCTIESVSDDMATVRVEDMSIELGARDLQPGSASLAVRPNRIHLNQPETANTITGVIDRITYVGNHLEITAKTTTSELFITTTQMDIDFVAGSNVGLSFSNNGPVLLKDTSL